MGWAGRYKNAVCPKTTIKQWERCSHVSFNQRMCQHGLAVRVYLYIYICVYIWVNYNEVPEDLLDDQVEDVKSPSMMTVVELVMSQVYRISKIDIYCHISKARGLSRILEYRIPLVEIFHKKIMDEFATRGDNDVKNLSILIFNLLKIYFNRHPSAWNQKLKDVAKAFTSVRRWRAMPNAPLQWAA